MENILIKKLITDPSDESNDLLFENSTEVFWVDWREEDSNIVDYCESILKTNRLSCQCEGEGEKLFIKYGNTLKEVPLTISGADRHITLLALNEILKPDFEIRMVWASDGGDTLAFAPLSGEVWNALELEFSIDSVSKAFLKLSSYPNVFTDPLSNIRAVKMIEKKWWKFWT